MNSRHLFRLLTLAAFALSMTFGTAHADELWVKDIKKAKMQAKKENKLILIKFTGSDWCPPCKALAKHVMSTKEFKDWAKKNVILLYLDFPKNKKMSAAQKKHNYALQKHYKISGYPTVIITDAKGKEIGRKVGGSVKVKSYLQALTGLVNKGKGSASQPSSRPSR